VSDCLVCQSLGTFPFDKLNTDLFPTTLKLVGKRPELKFLSEDLQVFFSRATKDSSSPQLSSVNKVGNLERTLSRSKLRTEDIDPELAALDRSDHTS
jgi:hypothetical protein